MKRRRIFFWGFSTFVILMLGVWFLGQQPDELGGWVRELTTRPAVTSSPRPPPPPPPPKRAGPCVGLTWTVVSQQNFVVKAGAGDQQQPVSCDRELSVLCFNGSELALSSVVSGRLLSSRGVGDALCGVRLGPKMRMASVHDGWNGLQGKGELPANVRFWVAAGYPNDPWD
jgi:hypothetical protein